MSRRLIATAVAVLACAIPLAASAALSAASGKVVVTAKLHGPMNAPLGGFEGTSTKLSVEDNGKELKFSVPVSSIDTDNGGRNGDMVKRFAKDQTNVVLTVPRDKIKFPTDKSTNGTVQGSLSINAVSTNVPVKYSAKKEGAEIVITGSFSFDYTPHHFDLDTKKKEKGVEACRFGVCVTSKLDVEVNARLKE